MISSALDFLNQAVFQIGRTPTTVAELLGFVTGALAVWLVARNNIATFPVGIANAAFFFVLFLDARLYADAWLQVFFLVVQLAGWIAWAKAGPNRTELPVRAGGLRLLAGAVAAVAVVAYLLVPVLREAHGAYPAADASSTALSVAAQSLMTLRVIEHWYLWIVADLIFIPLYAAKGLYFTSALYVVFLALCVRGLSNWRRIVRGRATPIQEPALPLAPAQLAGREAA